MKLNLFSKSKSEPRKPASQAAVSAAGDGGTQQNLAGALSGAAAGDMGSVASPLIEKIHVSEKSARLESSTNTYVFRVADTATKSEVAKAIARQYGVKVSKVRTVNLPRKRRDTGRFPGYRAGYRKALVTLAPGQTIAQAKA